VDFLPLAAPALPLDEAGKYVAAAYVVFVVLIVVYVAIMAAKLQRIERELRELAGFAETRANGDQAAPGRGSEEPSISDSLAPHGSRGGGA
jgi:CcmD family protein